ncbi:Imm3 family immunity protein [Lysinibacillus sphaericus]|uniref:Imm3 family immunity protein n=1 Tax=Lysinibacillus sphaericus TaxID=1421 RepID=UPI0004DF515B|nr:Imm3 family immunity protein [Lysinibacillus sphaericus]MBG9694396.1 hypothetical protein [Lysinibacillus sphaericus]QPA57448.1 hypothetical protein INQ55_14745 [Lysinibacillus sphaericus]
MGFSYEEYKEYIYEDYDELIEEKMSKREAMARTFYEYDMLAKESETDKAMVFVIFSEIAITHTKVLSTFKDYLEQMLTELNFNKIKQEGYLKLEQYEELFSRKEYALQKLNQMPIDYYPRVCWYYNELNEEVRKFIDNYIKKSENVESIISSVLQRFNRDCKNTNSEKFIIYTTLAETLYNFELTNVLDINEIKHKLEKFSAEDITDEQLTEEEQDELSERINLILTRLNS